MTDDVATQLYAWLTEAAELRYGVAGDPQGVLTMPAYEEGPQAFSAVLIRARSRSDRVEELMHKAGRVRNRLAGKKKDAEFEAQAKMNESIDARGKSKVEFSSRLELEAGASLDSFAEKRAAHEADRRLDVAAEVHGAITEIHWGLNGFRADVREIMRSFQQESSLER